MALTRKSASLPKPESSKLPKLTPIKPKASSAQITRAVKKTATIKTVKREYNDFQQFVADMNDVAIRVGAAKFLPGIEVDLNVLAGLIQTGKCTGLSSLVLEGVKFINVHPGDSPLKPLLQVLENVDRDPNARLLSKFFTLDISNLNVPAEDAESLAHLFSKFQELNLKLDNNLLGDAGAQILAAALKAIENKAGRKIGLSLQNNNLSDAGLKYFLNIFDDKFVDLNIRWSIELGNRRKHGKRERQNKYSDDENADIFLQIKSQAFIPLFKGSTAIIKLDGMCDLGVLVKTLFASSDIKSMVKSVVTSHARATPVARPQEQVLMPSPSHRYLYDDRMKRKPDDDAEKQNYKTFAEIVRCLDGVPENEQLNLGSTSFDNGNSKIFGARLHADYIDGINRAEATASQDYLIIGYSHRGLPFQIMVNGHDENNLMAFIKPHVTPLMARYADDLSSSGQDYQTVLRRFINDIYTLQAEHAVDTNFAMAISIVYEQQDNLYCAGFSIGKVRLLLAPNQGQGQISLAPRRGPLTDDAFNADCFTKIEEVIAHNHLFHIRVHAGDELFICSTLSEPLIGANNCIDVTQLTDTPNFFEAVKEANLRLYKAKRDRIEAARGTEKFGDDSALGVTKVPTKDLQAFIKEYVRLESLLWENKAAYPDLYDKGKLLADRIRRLKSAVFDEDLPGLTGLIKTINQAIQFPTEATVEKLMVQAKSANGAFSPWMKGLGIALMAVGAVLAVIGGFAIAAGYVAFLAGLFPLGVPSLTGGSLMLAGGVTMAGTGLTLFLQGKKHTGLAKELEETAVECRKLLTTP